MGTQSEILPYSEEWKAARLGKFTSSELVRLMAEPTAAEKKEGQKVSKGAITYIMECVAEILSGQSEEEGFISKEMEWGTAHEREALDFYNRKTGRLIDVGVFIIHSEWVCGTPDGVEDIRINDVKCPKTSTHIDYLLLKDVAEFKQYYPKYYWQLIGNAWLAGKDKATFISYDPRMKHEFLKMKVLDFDVDPIDKAILITKIDNAIEYMTETLDLLSKMA